MWTETKLLMFKVTRGATMRVGHSVVRFECEKANEVIYIHSTLQNGKCVSVLMPLRMELG